MWRGTEPIAGSASAISRLVASGHHVVFCTNHATSPEVKVRQLAEFGVPDAVVLTSAMVAASVIAPSERVLCLGDETLHGVLSGSGVDVTDVSDLPDDGPVGDFDVVVVGASPNWDRSRTGLAADAVRQGARFLATNTDPTYPYTGTAGPRLLPGAGALVAAVEVTAGRQATVLGKPNRATVEAILHRYGPVDYVVGDVPEMDGLLAAGLGAAFALVLSGVTSRGDLPVQPAAGLVGDDLAEIVEQVLGTE